MRLTELEYLINSASASASLEWRQAVEDVRESISRTVWPPGASDFAIYPESGKRRGEGSGVRPIKDSFMVELSGRGWNIDERSNPGRMDAVKLLEDGRYLGLEWETGNVSSSHRALNRIVLGYIAGECAGGILVLPTKELAKYLTDRVGNWEELARYFPVWKEHTWENGALLVLGVRHDRTDTSVPRIRKGTDGRAER